MNRHDAPAMTALSLALLVALVLFVRLLVGPTGDGPHGAIPTVVVPGSIMTATPPFVVYMEEVKR